MRVFSITPLLAAGLVPVPSSQPFRIGFDDAIAAIGDVTGDGVPELAVAITSGTVVYSGKDGAIVWRSREAAFAIAPIQDVDGDRVGDVLLGGDGVRILSGATGKTLQRFDAPRAPGFGSIVGSMGDLDGDGSLEFLGGGDDSARIFTTKTDGSVIVLGTSERRCYEPSLAVVGDVDADGRLDLGWIELAPKDDPTPRTSRVRLVSGRTRETIALLDFARDLGLGGSSPCFQEMDGHRIFAAGDVDGDGHGDFHLAVVGHCVRTISGRDHAVLATFADPFPGGYSEGFGDTVAALGDLDGDGAGDVAIGCREYLDSGGEYYAAVFSGRTGKKLHAFVHEHRPGHFHFVAAPGDVDGDGVPDVAVLVPDCESLTIYSGKSFRSIRALHPPGD